MSYVMQGTVQVELKTKPDETQTITIRINPTQDYMVKRGKEEYIVFTSDNPKTNPDARVFEKNTTFTTIPDSLFLQSLTHAAFKQDKIEIKATFPTKNGKTKETILIVIDSITIPAAF